MTGSGSVLINVLTVYAEAFDSFICSDINKQLIDTFKEIQNNHENLIGMLELIQTFYENLDEKRKEEVYYEYRDIYNKLIQHPETCEEEINNIIVKLYKGSCPIDTTSSPTLLTSALFIFLNKTCFRGLYRVNNSGCFNVPYGNYKKPKIVDSELLRHLHELFTKNKVEFIVRSYEEVLPKEENVLIYLDPPYYNTFDNYSMYKFDYNQFEGYLSDIENKNIPFILSNSYDFEEYVKREKKGLYVEEISINDRINSKQPANKRFEILATNF